MAGEAEQAERGGRRADAVANRERVLDAARSAMADLGINAEIKDIAERAGVGVGTIYRHFEGKDGLLQAIISEVSEEMYAAVARGLETDDPIEGLYVFLTETTRVFGRYGWLVDAVLGNNLPPALKSAMEQERDEKQQMTAVLERCIATGVLRADLDVDMATRMLVGPLLTWKFQSPGEFSAPEESSARALDLFLRGAAAD